MTFRHESITAPYRQLPRIPCDLEVRVDHPGGVIDCHALDLSATGMRLHTGTRLEYGTDVTLNVRLPALPESSRLSGVVRWAREGQVGVQLLDLRAQEVWALQRLVKQLSRAQST